MTTINIGGGIVAYEGTEQCPHCAGSITVQRESPRTMTILHTSPHCPDFQAFVDQLMARRYPWATGRIC